MDELDFDPELFVPANGFWHIVDRQSADAPERLLRSLVIGQATGGRDYLVTFSDRDLADRFIESQRRADWVSFPFLNRQAWLAFLEDVMELGHEYIGFDPEPNGKFADFGKIATLVQSLRETLDGQE